MTRLVTGKVRFSYVHVFEPWSNDPEKEKQYSLTLLIPKSDTKTIAAIRKAQQDALEAGKVSKFGGKIPANWKDTLHDGDTEADTDENPELAGHMYMAVSARAEYPPGVVDKDLNPILDRSEVYSGCYGRVSLEPYAYNTSGNRGVSFGLRNVQKLDDGELLGGSGRANPEDDFGTPADEDASDLI